MAGRNHHATIVAGRNHHATIVAGRNHHATIVAGRNHHAAVVAPGKRRMTSTPADAPFFGAHISTAGGVGRAFDRATTIGATAMQIFVKSPAQWRGPELSDAVAGSFRAERAARGMAPVVAHAGYLINLAASDTANLIASRAALADELRRAARLGLDALILHPGAHLGEGAAAGLARAAESLAEVLDDPSTRGPRLLLENTAGHGSLLGSTWEELALLRRACGHGDRIGVCLDTCHAFAAGHAIDEESGYEAFFADLDARFERTALGCVHVNDSLLPRGARRDRHANLGKGCIGRELFVRLARDPRFTGLPLIVETPSPADLSGHRRDVNLLRRAWREGRAANA